MGNWKDILDTLTSMINAEGKSVCEALSDPAHFSSEILEPGVVLTSEAQRNDFEGRKGLYIFLMTNTVHLTRKEVSNWNSRPSEAGLTSTLEQTLAEGDCLYLGSVYSKTGSLCVRLGKHFGPSQGCDPHGLALSYPTRNIVAGKVKVIVFPLKREFNQYAPRVLPGIEKVLHNRLRPKAGSSRT